MTFYKELHQSLLRALEAIGPMTFKRCDGLMLQEAANISRELHLIIRRMERLEHIANSQLLVEAK